MEDNRHRRHHRTGSNWHWYPYERTIRSTSVEGFPYSVFFQSKSFQPGNAPPGNRRDVRGTPSGKSSEELINCCRPAYHHFSNSQYTAPVSSSSQNFSPELLWRLLHILFFFYIVRIGRHHKEKQPELPDMTKETKSRTLFIWVSSDDNAGEVSHYKRTMVAINFHDTQVRFECSKRDNWQFRFLAAVDSKADFPAFGKPNCALGKQLNCRIVYLIVPEPVRPLSITGSLIGRCSKCQLPCPASFIAFQ